MHSIEYAVPDWWPGPYMVGGACLIVYVCGLSISSCHIHTSAQMLIHPHEEQQKKAMTGR